MNPIWKNIIISTIVRSKDRKPGSEYSEYRLAKLHREFVISVKRNTRDAVIVTVGIFSAAFGLKGFLLPNHFIDGGVTGISLLTSLITDISLPWLIVLINIPFILLGSNIIGKTFAIKTVLAIAGLSLCLSTVSFPEVTKDSLLVAVFGGFFLGSGIGLAMRGGAVIDGTEVLAIFLSRRIGATVGDIIIVINVIIFCAAAYLLSVETALYSMITYLSASKTLDFIIEGIEEYIGVTVISSHHEDIRLMIIENMGRGVTIYKGKRGFGKRGESKDLDIVYTVITRLEINKLNLEIEKIDPNAFVVMNPVKDIIGGIVKKRPLQH